MSPPWKPVFKPPVASSSASSSTGSRGAGWLLAAAESSLAKNISVGAGEQDEEPRQEEHQGNRTKAGWLLAQAELNNNSSQSQPSSECSSQGLVIAMDNEESDSGNKADDADDELSMKTQPPASSQSSQPSRRKCLDSKRTSSSSFDLLGSQEILSQLSNGQQSAPTKSQTPAANLGPSDETLDIMSVQELPSSLPPATPSFSKKPESSRTSQDDNPDLRKSENDLEIVSVASVVSEAEVDKDQLENGEVVIPGTSGTQNQESVVFKRSKPKPAKKKVTKKTQASFDNDNVQEASKKKTGKSKASSTKKDSDTSSGKTATGTSRARGDKKKPSLGTNTSKATSAEMTEAIEEVFQSLMETSETVEGVMESLMTQVIATSDTNLTQAPEKPKKRKVAKKPKKRAPEDDVAPETPPAKKPRFKSKKQGGLGHVETKEALMRLQELRQAKTWAMCTQCGKWRYVDTKDPSEIKTDFTCPDNGKVNSCSDPEQLWDKSLTSRMVETRFTVGSLVWARLEGWPSWPAMVDDDPDTGDFFWTEWGDGKMEDRPTSYHVVFFDEKEVSRAWIPSSRLRKFDGVRPAVSSKNINSRLRKSFDKAVEASKLGLTVRRKTHCFAAVFTGSWGPVWPGHGEEEGGWDDGPDYMNVEQISQDIMSQPKDARNMSFIDKSFNCDILQSLDNIETVNNNNEESQVYFAKRSKPLESPVSHRAKKTPKKTPRKPQTSVDKENVEPGPANIVSHLYQDSSLYTQEMSHPPAADKLTMSFTDTDILNSSLAREVSQALDMANMFTPIKKTRLSVGADSPCPGSLVTTSTPVRPELNIVTAGPLGDTGHNNSAAFDESFN